MTTDMPRLAAPLVAVLAVTGLAWGVPAAAQTVAGRVTDQTGGVLPGVSVGLVTAAGEQTAVTDASGDFRFDHVEPGAAELTYRLINFTVLRRSLVVGDRELTPASAVLTRTRPLTRSGEVLEAVPGLVISQHSGEGKANQYYLRGFNRDHGTDFSTSVAGIPVNTPTGAHAHGYADIGFLIPELVSGVQFKKGPYFADEGDFSAAGAASISYVNHLDRPLIRLSAGGQGWGRVLGAASPAVGRSRLLAALEVSHTDGPWQRPDDFQKTNAVLRYSRGNAQNGLSLTGLVYSADWKSTDQVPQRALDRGLIGRFGLIDPSNGGQENRQMAVADWQRTAGSTALRATGYAQRNSLNLFSYARLTPWMTVDGDLSFSRARFTEPSPSGNFVPGALDRVVSAGFAVEPSRTVFGSLRLRHFGPRPLVEDASVRSSATSIWNGEIGYRLSGTARLVLEGYNLLDATVADIDYFYTSRLPGEPAEGVDDVHTHPAIPRTARLSLQLSF